MAVLDGRKVNDWASHFVDLSISGVFNLKTGGGDL